MMRKTAPILIVDDDVEDHVILEDYFSDLGLKHYLQFASDGKTALELLEGLADNELPEIIVLDLNMPILNGTQTLLELKRSLRYKEIPVIIYSTSENDNEKSKCLSFGALDYVVKPSDYESGMKTVQYLRSLVKNF
ncbi:response regulator [Chryseolinea lacunae]|uniref:Response regulator n=1 Tax=Chryseolinea lacunae TaxID=2801331 RepID=A0ABS1L2B5_9BACT|nr:response regulator [Chryseolinea lacunae]MBL0745848.1 response regulator [Chryseolinea lacunae]